jgi:hypothetical protein
MINVRTRGEHEGRCEDLDALRCVEAVRSEATPGPRAAGTEKKPRGSRPHLHCSPDRKQSLFILGVKIDMLYTTYRKIRKSSICNFPAQNISNFHIKRQTFRI